MYKVSTVSKIAFVVFKSDQLEFLKTTQEMWTWKLKEAAA